MRPLAMAVPPGMNHEIARPMTAPTTPTIIAVSQLPNVSPVVSR